MSKNITIKVTDSQYDLLKKAADGEKRSLLNFIEYATLAYLADSFTVSDEELQEITSDKNLTKSLNKGLTDIKKGKYKIVG